MTTGFNGRHMAAILVAFFAVVIAVNVAMARLAVSTFGGEVVENSYVASQHFNRWLGEAAAEQALGWKVAAEREPDDRLSAVLTGAPADATLSAIARHPLGRLPDQPVTFTALGGDRFVSSAPLPAGRWQLRIKARAAGHVWRSEVMVP